MYFDVTEEEGNRRVFGHLQQENDRNEDNNIESIEDVKESLRKRLVSDKLRYKKYYGIDVNDVSNYDFYFDTTNLTQDEVFQSVYDFVQKNLDISKN